MKTRTVKGVAFSNFGCMDSVSNTRAGYPPGGERMFESGCQGAADQKPPGLVNSLLLLSRGGAKTKISSEDDCGSEITGVVQAGLSKATHSLLFASRLSCKAGRERELAEARGELELVSLILVLAPHGQTERCWSLHPHLLPCWASASSAATQVSGLDTH